MEILAHKLKHALVMVAPAVAPRSATIEILTNVLFQSGKLVATNLEMAIAADLPEVEGDAFTLPYRSLSQVLKGIPDTQVLLFARSDHMVNISFGNGQVNLSSHDPDESPGLLPDIPGEAQSVDGDKLVKALVGTAPYSAREATRPTLTCVCITLGDPIEVAAADGYRLAWQELPLKLARTNGVEKHILLPRNSVLALEKVWRWAIKPPGTGASLDLAQQAVAKRMMQVRMKPDWAQFQFGEATVCSQLLQGEFPDYRSLITGNLPLKLTFDAEAAHHAVQMSSSLSDSSTIRMEWQDKTLEFSSQTSNKDSIRINIPTSTQTGPGRIAFNSHYLLNYLSGKHGLVLMEVSTPSCPGQFTTPGEPGMVLMPMYIQWGDESPTEKVETEDE